MNMFIIWSLIALAITVPYTNAINTIDLGKQLEKVLRIWFNLRSAQYSEQKPQLLIDFNAALAEIMRQIYCGSVVAKEVQKIGNLLQIYNTLDPRGSPNGGTGIAPKTTLTTLGIASLQVAPKLTEAKVMEYATGKAGKIFGTNIDKLVVRYQGFVGPLLKQSPEGLVPDGNKTEEYVFIIMALADEE